MTVNLKNAGATAHERARIYQWAYRLLRNHHDALDVTQEITIKTLTASPREDSRRRAWLHRATVNRCIDLIRRRRPTVAMPLVTDKAAPPESGLQDAQRHLLIAEGLGHLSPAQRAVLVAKVYDQETFAAIASHLGMAPSTVKTHYLRALQAMRASLQRHEDAL